MIINAKGEEPDVGYLLDSDSRTTAGAETLLKYAKTLHF
jgi:hypothetical protein